MSQGKVGRPPTLPQNPKRGRRCLRQPKEAPVPQPRTPSGAGLAPSQGRQTFRLSAGHPQARSGSREGTSPDFRPLPTRGPP